MDNIDYLWYKLYDYVAPTIYDAEEALMMHMRMCSTCNIDVQVDTKCPSCDDLIEENGSESATPRDRSARPVGQLVEPLPAPIPHWKQRNPEPPIEAEPQQDQRTVNIKCRNGDGHFEVAVPRETWFRAIHKGSANRPHREELVLLMRAGATRQMAMFPEDAARYGWGDFNPQLVRSPSRTAA